MNGFVLLIRLALSLVFAVAGIAKLLDLAGSRRSLREFGVPAVLAPTLAIALPLVELGCAFALVRGAWAWWGAVGSLALLGIFVAAIAANLARGRTPDCHCFGKLHSEPVGWTTVARNAALALLAASVVAQGAGNTGPGLVTWLTSLSGTQAMFFVLGSGLVALAAFVVMILVQLLAQNGRLMLRVEALEEKLGGRTEAPSEPGLAVNSEAPSFSLSGLDGIPVSLEALRAFGKPLLLVFAETGCSACEALLPNVARWQREHSDRLIVIPISRGDLQVNKAKAVQHRLENVLLQENREVADAYNVQGTPSAVLVKDGLIASPLAAGPDAIRDLVFRTTLPPAVKKGDVAPALLLRDLDGNQTAITTRSIARRRVLLFWNPSCGFCNAMLTDLKSWERTRSRHAPELVVVSAGSADANRALGLRSRILLDPVFGVGQVFGATGTPSAVAIDEEGRVASEVGVGAPAVLALLGAPIDKGVAA
jgi:thioredoxin-related protein